MKMFLYNIPTLICVGIAGYLAYFDKPGWGWFLVWRYCLRCQCRREIASARKVLERNDP